MYQKGRIVVIVHRLFVFVFQVVAMLSRIVHDAFDEVLEML